MTRRSNVLPSLALALLLGASILAINPTEAVTPTQEGAMRANFVGDDAAVTDWQIRTETTRLYIHSDPSINETVPPGSATGKWVGTPEGAVFDVNPPTGVFQNVPVGPVGLVPSTQAHAEAAKDPDDRQLIIALPGYNDNENLEILGRDDTTATTAIFDMEPVIDDVRLYGFSGLIYAACTDPSTEFDGTSTYALQATLTEQTQEDGEWVDVDEVTGSGTRYLVTGGPGGAGRIVAYQTEGGLGNPAIGTGQLIEKGNRLRLELALPSQPDAGLNWIAPPGTACIVHYDTTRYPSQFVLQDNSMRVALFASDRDGVVTTGFPAGDSTSSANRRLFVQAGIASPWPDAEAQLAAKRIDVRLYDLENAEYLYYVDNLDGDQNANLESNIHVIEQISKTSRGLSESHIVRTFEFAYGADITEARIQPQLYRFSPAGNYAQWEIQGDEFRIGGKGITLSLIDGESATHLINRGQRTQFSLRVSNIGTQDDVVSVSAAELTGGWQAAVTGGGQVFVAAGRSAIVVVEVTPPAGAVPPASMQVPVRASSSFADVPDPAVINLRATVTDTVIEDLEVIEGNTLLQVRPGVAKNFALTVRNNGTSNADVAILASTPSNIQGWTLRLSPTSFAIPAGGSMQVQLTVTAPAEAPGGLSFPLGLTAVLVGDASVSDRVDVTVRVFPVEGVVAEILAPLTNRTLRQMGDDSCTGADENTAICVAYVNTVGEDQQVDAGGQQQNVSAPGRLRDTDFDQTGLFRVEVQNLGDAADAFKVDGFWLTGSDSTGIGVTASGTDDRATCEVRNPIPEVNPSAGPDGVPDGWRFNGPLTLGQPLPADPQRSSAGGARQGFSGVLTLNDAANAFAVGPRSTAFYLMELGMVDPACFAGDEIPGKDAPLAPSDIAHFFLRFTSVNEPTRSTSVVLRGGFSEAGAFRGANDYSGGIHDVGLQPGLNEVTSKSGALGSAVEYNMVAYNAGNEYDDLTITLNSPPTGWTHRLQVTGSVPPGIVQCDAVSASGRSVLCPRAGVFDEVHFKAIATPSTQVPVGQSDTMTVRVASGDAPTIDEALTLVTRAAGTFGFEAAPRGNATRTGAPGTTVPLPFIIQNLGTEADTYHASLLISDPKWSPVLSTGGGLFLPADSDGAGYLAIDIPTDAPLGTPKQFRIAVDSVEGEQRKVFDLFVTPTSPGRLALSSEDGQDLLLPKRGEAQDVEVRAVLTSGSATPVKVRADQLGLPPGWTVTPSSKDIPMTATQAGRPTGTAVFQVTAPGDALSTSRATLRFTGTDAAASDATVRGTTDVVLNLASTFGIELNATAPSQVIAPGGSAVYDVAISNLGLGPDTVRFTNTALPEGWRILVNPASPSLGPLERSNVTVKIDAPVTAQPKDVASVVLFAMSVGEPTVFDSLTLTAQVGFNEITAVLASPVPYAAPEETLVYVFNVTNTGTLPDEVRVGGTIEPSSLREQVESVISPSTFGLDPNETAQVRVDLTLASKVPSGATLVANAVFTSLLDERDTPAAANVTAPGHVLAYESTDINSDGILEYAIDRNRDTADGFEEVRLGETAGGLPLGVPDLERFLRDDARAAFERDVTLDDGTTRRVLVYTIDGDEDQKADHFFDKDGDGQPDFYWDPDARKASPIEFRKDINGDQVPESFVDTDGDGEQDRVFDLTRGTFIDVIKLDVDGDGKLDYVVDKDGDGVVDQDETVLYTRTGGLLIVQKVDVDGDERLDQVFDTDGDGRPDYFIPDGSDDSVEIGMRDVNGDGVQDWTFDGDGDGRKESYYDPVTGKAHVIEASGHFVDALRQYWYVGALFALVVVLFVALVLVTRR